MIVERQIAFGDKMMELAEAMEAAAGFPRESSTEEARIGRSNLLRFAGELRELAAARIASMSSDRFAVDSHVWEHLAYGSWRCLRCGAAAEGGFLPGEGKEAAFFCCPGRLVELDENGRAKRMAMGE